MHMTAIPLPLERPVESKDSVPLMLSDIENKKKKSEFWITQMHM